MSKTQIVVLHVNSSSELSFAEVSVVKLCFTCVQIGKHINKEMKRERKKNELPIISQLCDFELPYCCMSAQMLPEERGLGVVLSVVKSLAEACQ